jgi:hypothetical protein
MAKLCLHCFKKISLLAGRCPYCLEEHQGVWGRLLLVLMVLAGFWLAYRYTSGQWPF